MNQKQRVLAYMEEFGSITSLEAFRDLGITRLSAVIFDLRDAGYPIDSKTESSTNRFGDKTSYSRYSLRQEPKQLEMFEVVS